MKNGVFEAFRVAASDRVHGAVEIEIELIDSLKKCRVDWTAENFLRGSILLGESHPEMANLVQLVEIVGAGVDLDRIEAALDARRSVLEKLPQLFAKNAVPLLERSERIVTISRSSAVAAVVGGLVQRGWCGQIIVLDGSVSGRGVDQAIRLESLVSDVRSQPDATAPTWVAEDGVKIDVLVGADAVSDRFFINAIGTLLLFQLAERAGVDRTVVADSAKQTTEEGFDNLLLGTLAEREPGPRRSWPPLERIPTGLMSRWISERGVLRRAPWDWSQS
jgi:translation initiation factor 2B subunit (eIF-2B alpha/beta/delta family)